MATDSLALIRDNPAEFRRRLYVRAAKGVARFGDILYPFQREGFEAFDRMMLALMAGHEPDPSGIWCERTKGASKTSDFCVAILHAIAFSSVPLLIRVGASDEGQGYEVLKEAKSILAIPQNAWLHKFVKIQATQLIGVRTDSTVEVLSVDSLGSHGSRPSLTVIEECSHQRDWDYINTLLDDFTKTPGGLVVLTNHGSTDSPAYKLREIARTCTTGRWKFLSYTDVAPWISREKVAERKKFASGNRARRYWGGLWTADNEEGLDEDLVQSCVVLQGPHGYPIPAIRYYLGVDSGVVHDACSCVVLGVDAERRKIFVAEDRAFHPPRGGEIDLSAVEDHIRDTARRYQAKRIRIDRSHFFGNVQSLRRDLGAIVEGISVTSTTLKDFAAAVLSVFRGHQIELYPGTLVDEILALRIEDCGTFDKVRADTDSTGHKDSAFGFLLALLDAVEALRLGDDWTAPSSLFVGSERRYTPLSNEADAPFRHGIPYSGASRGRSNGWTRRRDLEQPPE